MTEQPDELNALQQIQISRAHRAGVPTQKIADHLGVTLEQVNETVALLQKFRDKEESEAAWIEANKTEPQ